ncbi:MAG: endo-1,4-beta-xylanase [Chitinispirillaceae bacterium]|nr:endo-1,4-beta-xylanase [Chitinispirillaceae bacterium]
MSGIDCFRPMVIFKYVLLIVTVPVLMARAEPIAEGSSKFLGNITNGTPQSNYADYWNQITLENGGKWEAVQPSNQSSFNWGQTDAAYNYCKEKGWPYKHHCFVWGNQQPGWVNSSNARSAVENYIRTFGEKYPDCYMIDVVNEPLHAPAKYKDGLGGNGSTGWDWVITVFEMARKYCPKSKLILNDYGIVNDGNATRRYLEIINLLKDRELIDMIGVQSHYFNLENVRTSTIQDNLDALAETGLPITSSEFDLRGDENTQLDRYKTYFPLFWEHPAVVGVTLWGYTNNWGGAIIMSGGREYAALKWLRTYVDSMENVEHTSIQTPKAVDVATVPVTVSFSGGNALSVRLSSPDRITVTVVNPNGEMIVRSSFRMISREQTITLPENSLSPGVYAVMVKGLDFQVVRQVVR